MSSLSAYARAESHLVQKTTTGAISTPCRFWPCPQALIRKEEKHMINVTDASSIGCAAQLPSSA